MPKWIPLFAIIVGFACAACGAGDASPEAAGADVTAASSNPTVASPSAQPGQPTPAATPTTPRQALPLQPSIADALSCRVPPVRKDTEGTGGQLQRYDLTAFPAASCNDGSPAVLYFRPYAGEANKDRWIILLNGGGGCGTGQDCANRWCSVDTNFDADNMSTENASGSLNGGGVLERSGDNPFGNYNQVQVRYCSSDAWTGQALGVDVSAKDPKTGGDVRFQMNFAGSYVFEAMLVTLRGDGPERLVYSRTKTEMPDLDEANVVVFAGGSAGGAGVISNLDRFADALGTGPNKPTVFGFIEAIVGPDQSKFGYASTNTCKANGLCSYEAVQQRKYELATDPDGQRQQTDESCLDWHAKNKPGTEWRCYDQNHLLANHVTTPYFIRTSLTDALRASEAIQQGFSTPDGKMLTWLTYGEATADFLNGLQGAIGAGDEGASITKLPGIFGTACHTHYTLLQTKLVQGVKVSFGGQAYRLFDVWNNWVAGKQPDVVVTSNPRTDVCPGE